MRTFDRTRKIKKQLEVDVNELNVCLKVALNETTMKLIALTEKLRKTRVALIKVAMHTGLENNIFENNSAN